MKRVSLAVIVLFALVGFSVPSAAQSQYWPNIKEFNIPSNTDVMDARVKAALKEGKYRAEIERLRKFAVTQAPQQAKDLNLKIELSLDNMVRDINIYVAKMKVCADSSLKDKSCRSGYSMVHIYEDINNFSAAAKELNQYLFTVRQCSEALKMRHLPVKVADSCKTVISNKTFGYSKIMELSFQHNDRDNFFSAKKSLSKHLKVVIPVAKTTADAGLNEHGSKSLPSASAM